MAVSTLLTLPAFHGNYKSDIIGVLRVSHQSTDDAHVKNSMFWCRCTKRTMMTISFLSSVVVRGVMIMGLGRAMAASKWLYRACPRKRARLVRRLGDVR